MFQSPSDNQSFRAGICHQLTAELPDLQGMEQMFGSLDAPVVRCAPSLSRLCLSCLWLTVVLDRCLPKGAPEMLHALHSPQNIIFEICVCLRLLLSLLLSDH